MAEDPTCPDLRKMMSTVARGHQPRSRGNGGIGTEIARTPTRLDANDTGLLNAKTPEQYVHQCIGAPRPSSRSCEIHLPVPAASRSPRVLPLCVHFGFEPRVRSFRRETKEPDALDRLCQRKLSHEAYEVRPSNRHNHSQSDEMLDILMRGTMRVNNKSRRGTCPLKTGQPAAEVEGANLHKGRETTTLSPVPVALAAGEPHTELWQTGITAMLTGRERQRLLRDRFGCQHDW